MASQTDAGIACCTQATIGLMNHTYTLVVVSPTVADSATTIAGTIVNNDHLSPSGQLAYHGLKTSVESGRHIVYWYYYRQHKGCNYVI